jgi:hypothetical protein
MNDLSNMLSGILLALPSMLWVIVLISVVLWVIAFGFRSVIGPTDSHDHIIEKCGGFDGDSLLNKTVVQDIPECADTWRLYAEEYCPTVIDCSFMIFRCMIGDCTSKGGQSLPGHLTSGYGVQFQIVYCFGMLVLIFGLFNIITAIFVESTMKGLAAENLRAKRNHIYKTKQVKRSLERLVARIVCISEDGKTKARASVTTSSRLHEERHVGQNITAALFPFAGNGRVGEVSTRDNPSNLWLSEGAFTVLLKDGAFQKILEELDINIGTDNVGIFHGFKKGGNGQVRLQELLEGLMKLRGDASKADFVMPVVMVDDLADEIHEVQGMVANQQRELRRSHHVQQMAMGLHGLPSPAVRQDGAQAKDEAMSPARSVS